MSGLFGGGSQTISTAETPLSAFNIQSSVYGKAIPLLYGRNRLAGNLIDYDDFTAIPHTTSHSSGGGKGGGGITTENTTYTYQVSFILGLAEGVLNSINAYWVDKEFHNSASNFTQYLGTLTQTPWPTWTSSHSEKALAYRGLGYVAAAAYDLGGSAGLGNHSFDITGMLPYAAGTIDGADPKEVIRDYLIHPLHGAGFPLEYVGDWTQFSNFCVANNLFLSPCYEDQQEARQHLDDLVRLTNAGIFFSEGQLKIVPYSDQAAAANGASYTPVNVISYDLGDDDYLDHDQPVRVLRTPNADACNLVRIEYRDAANQYNAAIAEAKDQVGIELYGTRPLDTIVAHSITSAVVAGMVAQFILQRQLYTRNVYETRVGWRFARLEPCDYVSLTDARLGLDRVPVRVLSVEEDEDGGLTLTAEDAPAGVASSPLYEQPSGGGAVVNYGVDPGSVMAPAFFEVPATKALSGLAIGIAVTGNSADWGGAEIWASNDGDSYAYVGQTIGGARYGELSSGITAAVGQVAQVVLAGNGGQMISGSTADATNLSTLCIIDNEFVAHTGATLIAANTYDLTLPIRGAHATAPASHAVAAKFVRVDNAIAYSESLGLDMVGKTLYFKFLSFNKFGAAKQQLADVAEYPYEILGTMAKLPPPALSSLSALASANSIMLSWTNPADAATDRVEVWRNTVDDSDTAALIGSVRGPVGFYSDYLGAGGLTRYYWLRTINKQQFPSTFSAPASATTGTISTDPADGSITHAKLAADAVWAGNIKAGEVGADAIAANAITAGKIAANAISAAGGEIADLTVSTVKIQNDAVTVPSSVSGNTLTITSATYPIGTKIFVLATCNFSYPNGSTAYLYLKVDGVTLSTRMGYNALANPAYSSGNPAAISCRFTVTAASHTITLTSSATAGTPEIIAIGAKK